MTDEIIIKEQKKLPRVRVPKLLSKHSGGEPGVPNAKRERFLIHLKSRYGYSNDKAIDELERLLTQFNKSNKSLGIRRNRSIFKHPLAE